LSRKLRQKNGKEACRGEENTAEEERSKKSRGKKNPAKRVKK